MESAVGNLVALTLEFFTKHWNVDAIGCAPPEWSGAYRFVGSLPSYDEQGVYTFVKGDQATYIGVATPKSGGRYRSHGLGKRFQAYANVIDGAYTLVDPRLIDACAMVTIGFDVDHAYLANALELYRIGRLDTEHNANRPGSGRRPDVKRSAVS